uniref:Retrotransposon protein, putative, Ty3-gypsy sub-class n=2 Tax=Oryza sativa subsp. japonica TaxID=39947 RepID=Q2QZC2_ORYSJ|nr:retrotransposon protein, putative, Ty3-gypsy sub-class [Oryza sativa Japonica Group]ABA95442.1 retrotransposon protein, putative, Ty3-gypsy subclass [Oryza sativa Japonica Group]
MAAAGERDSNGAGEKRGRLGGERGREALGFIGRRCRFGNRPWAVKGASWRSSLVAKTATEADDAGGEGKRKKEGRKGACPLPLWEKKEGAGATRQREEELCLRPLEASAWSGGGRVVTTAMTVGAVWSGAATRATGAGRRGRC